jgi:TonB-dependent starch-binding outer membrane protein SusC
MTRILTFLSMLFIVTVSYSQELKGVVLDENNIPLPGANIVCTNSNHNAVTDFDGNFSIKVEKGEKIKISYIGYRTLELTPTFPSMTIVMEMESNTLNEVVLIGYGKQKKADLTGAINSVDGKDISRTPSSNVTAALQGKVAGVIVTNSGAPGVGADIKLRGVGTFIGDTKPLFVVDGMYYNNIDFLDPSDIKTLNILKDASSTAIFGVKGAGGVIIIETKTGSYNRKAEFSYQGYTGVQNPQNVLKMANSEQFVTMAYESGSQADIDAVLSAMQRYGRSRVNPNIPDVNTDWYEEILQQSIITNHNLGFSGGSETVNYLVSANYFKQDGLLSVVKNEYERMNLHAKVEAKLSDRFKVGGNFIFSNATQYFAENGVWNQIYFAVPILPIYDETNEAATPIRYANAKDIGYRGTQNPFPTLKFIDNKYKKRSLLTSVFAEYQILPEKLTFKTMYNGAYRPEDQRKVNLPYTMGLTSENISSLYVANSTGFDQTWDNTLTYNNSFGNHNVVLLAGTSYRDEAGNWFNGSGSNLVNPFDSDGWYLGNTELETRTSSSGANRFYAISYFGRLQYNYKDKYLMNVTMRAEGNSKYTKNPWGYFPGVGLGWVLSEEGFMSNSSFFDFLKLRASWGRNGNDKVPASAGSNQIYPVSLPIDDTQFSGTYVESTYTDFEWEIFEETNAGITARFLDSKLSLDLDYFVRDTKNAIIPVYQPIVSTYLYQNAGVLRNSGLEATLSWNNTINENLRYNFGLNLASLSNEVVDIYNQDYIDSGSAEFRQRSMEGEAINAFFGYEVAGVYQNLSEVSADPVATTNNLEPGDFRYVDQNNDGLINDDDRVVLGSYLPSFTFGANFGMDYKNWDFSLSLFGQTGNKILNRKRGEVIWTNDQNMDADLAINRWHGEGTSDSYPSSKGLRKGWNQKMSDFFVEDGSYFRIQNIQLGYNIKKLNIFKTSTEARVYLTAERPFTYFKYNGFSAEVFNGVDSQQYPVPAVYTFGLNVKI